MRSESQITRDTVAAIRTGGISSLPVNDLTTADLPDVSWSGGPLHIEAIRKAIKKAEQGEAEYLAVRAPSGQPVAIGAIDYTASKDAGKLWQLVTHEQLRGLGLGTRLIDEAEKHISKRGLKWATLSVEEHNLKAKKLYERLGYKIAGHAEEAWDELDSEGKTYTYKARVIQMKKRLNP